MSTARVRLTEPGRPPREKQYKKEATYEGLGVSSTLLLGTRRDRRAGHASTPGVHGTNTEGRCSKPIPAGRGAGCPPALGCGPPFNPVHAPRVLEMGQDPGMALGVHGLCRPITVPGPSSLGSRSQCWLWEMSLNTCPKVRQFHLKSLSP